MKLNAKFRAIVAIAMMLVGWLPTLAYDFCLDGIYYNILSETDKTVEVTYKNKDYTSYSGDIVIPELVTYNEIEYSVTSIGYNAFKECVGLSSIFIPNSVITIGDYAFSGCRNLYQIDLPNSISSIGSGAFKSARIRNITIPENVKTISPYTFEYSSLLSINIHNGVESIRGYAFRQCSLETINIPEGITEIEAGTFEYCGNLTTVYLPNSISEIYDYAFANCTSLKELYILRCDPPRVNSYAFQNLSNSLKVYVPFGCKSEYEAANYWKYLNIIELDPIFAESITLDQNEISLNIAETSELIATILPEETTNNTVAWTSSDESVATVGENGLVTAIAAGEAIITATIQDGSNLSATCKVTVNRVIPEVGTMFEYDCLTYEVTVKGKEVAVTTSQSGEYSGDIIIPESVVYDEISYSVTSIRERAFKYEWLTSVTIGNSITSIGEEAFAYCSGLTSIEIPNSITSIGYSAFSSCSGLTSVVWNAIKCNDFTYNSGEYGPFWDIRENITSFTFGGSVEHIPDHLCRGLSKLTSIEIPNLVTSIGKSAFYGCSGLTSIEIPNSVTSIGEYAFNGCSGLTSIEIPNLVTSIGYRAFYSCSGLTSVTIGNSVTSIGESAFSDCDSLTSIVIEEGNTVYDSRENCNAIIETATNKLIAGCQNSFIPNSVTSIGSSAFYYCTGLTSIEIPNSVTSIGESAFSSCSGLTSIEIPNSVTSIGSYVFSGCSGLTNATIGNSVTSIGERAFRGCSGLTEIRCLAIIPPTSYSNSFQAVDESIPLYVPYGCKSAYQSAEYWNGFTNIIEMEPEVVVAESITLDKTEISLYVAETAELMATVLPEHTTNKNVVWSSSDESIATVDEKGLVTAIAVGETDITATTTDGSNLSATCKVIVEPTLAESIVLDNSEITLKATETAEVTATILPELTTDKSVVWTSSDENVAIVDENGLVTAIAVGEANITATTTDGSNLSASCKVIVLPQKTVGDPNGDGEVNVTDVVAITNHILGSSSENFQADAADANGDGEINVTDVVAVTNIILGVAQVNELPSEDSTTSSELTLTDNGINDNGIQTIDVALFNDRDFTAFQADLRLPAGMELVDVVLSDRASSSHSMNLSVQADGSYRMISYSMVNEAYADNNGTLFTLVLKSTNAASGELVIEDIIFTTPQAIGYNLDNVVMEVAGTTALSTLPTDTRIYAQDGYIVIESPADCIAVISGVDGVARQVAVNAGMNKFEAMKGKVYIVKTLNRTVKVMM